MDTLKRSTHELCVGHPYCIHFTSIDRIKHHISSLCEINYRPKSTRIDFALPLKSIATRNASITLAKDIDMSSPYQILQH